MIYRYFSNWDPMSDFSGPLLCSVIASTNNLDKSQAFLLVFFRLDAKKVKIYLKSALGNKVYSSLLFL